MEAGAAIVKATPRTSETPSADTSLVNSLRSTMHDRRRSAQERLNAGLRLERLGILPPGLDRYIAVPGTGLFIAKYPVTNCQFSRFINAGGYGVRGGRRPPWWSAPGWQLRQEFDWTTPRYWNDGKFNRTTQPVVGLSWYEAEADCAWLNHPTSQRHLPGAAAHQPVGCCAQLPTRKQWMLAARNGRRQTPVSGTDHPWGSTFDTTLANTDGIELGQTTPVDMYLDGATPNGIFDLAGNVWEWTADRYEFCEDCFWLKGGSWWDSSFYARASVADKRVAWHRYHSRGFRVALVPGARL